MFIGLWNFCWHQRIYIYIYIYIYIQYINIHYPISIYLYIHNIYIYIYIYITYIYMSLYICMLYIYGFHHWRILWSSYRKLAWVGFEPTTTEFHSDPLIDWAFRWGDEFNLHSEPTLYNYSSFIVCSVSRLILAIAFISRHACFDICIYIYIYIYIYIRYNKYNITDVRLGIWYRIIILQWR